MNTIKPYSESCDQNRQPILDVIKPLLQDKSRLLEIGSGTGQHAVYFASQLPGLHWQTSDRAEGLAGINMWLQDDNPGNVLAPLELDVCTSQWPSDKYDACFSANTLHIMHESEVECLFTRLGTVLETAAEVILYGPFNYNGDYTSDSNRQFDQWLKSRDPGSGIKHFERVSELACDNGLVFIKDYPMPANNRILHFRKK